MEDLLAALDGDADAERAFGIAYASRQCEQLLAAGAPGIHFFVLNRATSVKAILGAIKAGVVPIPVNTLMTEDDYRFMLADSRARALVVSEALYPKFEKLIDRKSVV